MPWLPYEGAHVQGYRWKPLLAGPRLQLMQENGPGEVMSEKWMLGAKSRRDKAELSWTVGLWDPSLIHFIHQ